MRTKLLQTIHNFSGDVLTCCFAGRLLAVGSTDKLIRLFEVDANGRGFHELAQSPLCAHNYAVNYCQFTSMGSLLVSCSQDGKAIIWDVRTGAKLSQFEHISKNSLRICQFSPDARLLATGSDDETIGLWDISTRHIIRSLEGHEASVVALAFSPDGSYLVSGATSGDLRVWDSRFGHGRHLALVKDAHDLGVTCCQFSPSIKTYNFAHDNRPGNCMYLLATGGNDDLIKLWRVIGNATDVTRLEVSIYTVLQGQQSNIMCLAFSPNGAVLASGAGDKTVVIWDPIKGEKLHQIDHHQRYVTCCAFSSDGEILACGSNDKTISIWLVESKFGLADMNLIDFTFESDYLNDPQERRPRSASLTREKRIDEWTVDDVCSWLCRLDCNVYESNFRKNHVDGAALLELTDETLNTVLGIDSFGRRSRILNALKLLRDGRSGTDILMTRSRTDSSLTSALPNEFYCPITHELMVDPVIASDGYTYERSAITAWIDCGKRTSPMTNGLLPHLDLTPNRMLKMLIQKSRPA